MGWTKADTVVLLGAIICVVAGLVDSDMPRWFNPVAAFGGCVCMYAVAMARGERRVR